MELKSMDNEHEHRAGDWMTTYTGRQFWPLDPRPEDVDIIDIAHALSMICRYQGHTQYFYSVAEHAILMARHSLLHRPNDWEMALFCLLHDAAEAYVCDVVSPLKQSIPAFSESEYVVLKAIASKFDFPLTFSDHEYVRELDHLIRYNEGKALLPHNQWWEKYSPGLGAIELPSYSCRTAELVFLSMFNRLREEIEHEKSRPLSNQSILIVEERVLTEALVTDPHGRILFNCLQQDASVRRRQWSDGTYDIVDESTGLTILPRYDPNDDMWKPHCVNCGKDPFNEQTK